MTLYEPTSRRRITQRPFREHRQLLEQRLSNAEYRAVREHVDALIDGADKQIVTTGWLPGADWSDTPLEVLYTKAARGNQELAAKLFGLIVYLRVMDHKDDWGSGRYQVHGRDIGSRTYFRINVRGG